MVQVDFHVLICDEDGHGCYPEDEIEGRANAYLAQFQRDYPKRQILSVSIDVFAAISLIDRYPRMTICYTEPYTRCTGGMVVAKEGAVL